MPGMEFKSINIISYTGKDAIIFFFSPFLLVKFKCVLFLRIFQFENFDRTIKRILKTVEDEGALVCFMLLKDVYCTIWVYNIIDQKVTNDDSAKNFFENL